MSEIEDKNLDLDPTGQYNSGLKSLVHSLRLAFIFMLVLIIGMLIYFFSLGGYVEVKPQESVVVLRFGKWIQTETKGWSWYVPYPVTSFVTVRTSPQTLLVDFIAPQSAIGGAPAENSLEPGRDGYLLTGDANIVHTTWRILYQVNDPKRYYETVLTPLDPRNNDDIVRENDYVGTRGPQTLLRNLFRQAVVETTASLDVDGMLYDKKSDYLDIVQRMFIKLVAEADFGVEISSVSLDMVTPPAKTKPAFDEVAAANSTMDALQQGARSYEVETVNNAEAQSVAILTEAKTYSKQMVASVRADSLYFQSINEAYKKSPKTVLMSLYNSTISEVLEQQQDGKYILGSSTSADRKQVRLKINPEPQTQAKTPEEK